MARTLGVNVKTLARWVARLVSAAPLFKRRGGTMQRGSPESEQRVRDLVIELRGLVGADALSHSVTGVSRRRAEIIKCETLSALERERQAHCARVVFTTAGVVRGFDAMYLEDGYALTVADASIPFRTSIRHVPAYDAENVAQTLDDDFQTHGAPLVLREDRARCHTAKPVMSVLCKHRVLVLHGPAYYPRYYGQHERQNREHRSWMDGTPDCTQQTLDQMSSALNHSWRRRTLGWRSAAEWWAARPPLDDDRNEFHDDVMQRAARLRARGAVEDLAMRLAIEQALIKKGYLQIVPGQKVLCELTIS